MKKRNYLICLLASSLTFFISFLIGNFCEIPIGCLFEKKGLACWSPLLSLVNLSEEEIGERALPVPYSLLLVLFLLALSALSVFIYKEEKKLPSEDLKPP